MKKRREMVLVGLQRLVWHLVVKWSLSNRNWIEIDFESLYLLVGLIVQIVPALLIHWECVSEGAYVPSHCPGFVAFGTSRFH